MEILKSLKSLRKITWWIVLDDLEITDITLENVPTNVTPIIVKGRDKGIAGHNHRNYILDMITEDEWVYSVDDDNILHPGFLDELKEDREVIVVAQKLKDGSHRLNAGPVKLNHVDTAQFAIKRSLIGDVRFENRYDADGVFAEIIYNKYPEKFKLINQHLSYYNYLR